MTEKPTVDVIIPIYNTELYIQEALRSIENQTYPLNKVIIINDGSTDRSKEKIFEYQKQSQLNIVYIESENRGPAHARNLGIKASTADFISFHDADDVILPHKIASQIKLMTSHPEILFTHTHFLFTDEHGRHIETKLYNRNKGAALEGDVSNSIFYKVADISTPTVVVHRKALELVGLFDETMRYGEDQDLWIRISKVTKFGYIPELSLLMRRHATNTTNSEKMFEGMFNFYNKWLAHYPDDTLLVKDLRQHMTYPAYKNKQRYFLVKRALSKEASRKIFPMGSVDVAILLNLPYWALKSLERRLKKFFS